MERKMSQQQHHHHQHQQVNINMRHQREKHVSEADRVVCVSDSPLYFLPKKEEKMKRCLVEGKIQAVHSVNSFVRFLLLFIRCFLREQ